LEVSIFLEIRILAQRGFQLPRELQILIRQLPRLGQEIWIHFSGPMKYSFGLLPPPGNTYSLKYLSVYDLRCGCSSFV